MTFRLKNRHECPPNGFIVRVKQLDVERQFWSFGEAVHFYSRLAESNPQLGLPSDLNKAAELIDEMNATRCASIPNADHFYTSIDHIPSAPLATDVSMAPTMKQCCGRK
jgi:hypothetical protein